MLIIHFAIKIWGKKCIIIFTNICIYNFYFIRNKSILCKLLPKYVNFHHYFIDKYEYKDIHLFMIIILFLICNYQ